MTEQELHKELENAGKQFQEKLDAIRELYEGEEEEMYKHNDMSLYINEFPILYIPNTLKYQHERQYGQFEGEGTTKMRFSLYRRRAEKLLIDSFQPGDRVVIHLGNHATLMMLMSIESTLCSSDNHFEIELRGNNYEEI